VCLVSVLCVFSVCFVCVLALKMTYLLPVHRLYVIPFTVTGPFWPLYGFRVVSPAVHPLYVTKKVKKENNIFNMVFFNTNSGLFMHLVYCIFSRLRIQFESIVSLTSSRVLVRIARSSAVDQIKLKLSRVYRISACRPFT
jgi:hypothetical protein